MTSYLPSATPEPAPAATEPSPALPDPASAHGAAESAAPGVAAASLLAAPSPSVAPLAPSPPAAASGGSYAPAGHLRAGATRELTVAASVVRAAVLQVVRGLDFHATREQYSLIEAERGSKLRGLTMTRTRIPVALRVEIIPNSTGRPGSTAQITVEDRWPVTSTRRGTVAVYAEVFTEVLTALDAALARIDPTAAAQFVQWWRNLDEAEIVASRSRADGVARTERAVSKSTSRLLDGPRGRPTSALADSHLTGVTVLAPESIAHLSAESVDGMLTVGQLVASRPGAMPPKLVAEVEATVLRFEQRLLAIGDQVSGGLTIEVPATDVPVITFLYQQAAVREQLPVRLLMICTTCRLEKVVNPDLIQLRERNRRTKALTSSVGAVFGGHSISPFILVGRLSQIKKSEPDFVCARCQGTDADQRPITFCSNCGERLDSSVLRACPRCEYDLRTVVRGVAVWTELPPAPEPMPVAEPMPVTSPAEPWTSGSSATVGESVATVREVGRSGAPTDLAPAPPGGWGINPAWPQPVPSPPITPPGWYPDPWRLAEQRYWDGTAWTDHLYGPGASSPA